jgi:glucoamylase
VQLDETAFPVLLAAALADRNALRNLAVGDMVTRALGFIARTGPSSSQDRWEEDAGIGAYTLSVSIAALVAGASFLSEDARKFALVLADFWNANIEAWTSIMATPMANQLGVEGYFVRVAPADILSDPASLQQSLAIKNQEPGRTVPADEQISVDFLQLVRMGLRLPDDPLIRDSVAVVDALLKVDTPSGPTWHRYNGDGYGEHDDGRPFDGTGRGRAWPLLTGERGCYALAAGDDPMPYLKAMAAMTGPAGMMPEQVWDDTAMPDRRLWPGRPTGSAMPLAWAHAEFIKLMVSRHMGYSVDRPQSVWQRYAGIRPKVAHAIWSQHAPIGNVRRGDAILIALNQSARVRWTVDGWQNSFESQTVDTGVGLQVVEVAGAAISGTPRLDFTFQATGTGEPANGEFHIAVAD